MSGDIYARLRTDTPTRLPSVGDGAVSAESRRIVAAALRLGHLNYIANDLIGLRMAQVVYSLGATGVWVDCIGCGRRDRLPNAGPELTDQQAISVFEAHGWSVLPTLCPACRPADPSAAVKDGE